MYVGDYLNGLVMKEITDVNGWVFILQFGLGLLYLRFCFCDLGV